MKHVNYLWYVLRHKWFTFIECCKVFAPWRGITHDLSKFLPSEWFAYADNFYGKKQKGGRSRFNVAWCKHVNRNPHHWQYWVMIHRNGKAEAIPMPDKYIKEMVADWRAAGLAISGEDDAVQWYQKQDMMLHPTTRIKVEVLLKLRV